jgi:hypothetical protein
MWESGFFAISCHSRSVIAFAGVVAEIATLVAGGGGGTVAAPATERRVTGGVVVTTGEALRVGALVRLAVAPMVIPPTSVNANTAPASAQSCHGFRAVGGGGSDSG